MIVMKFGGSSQRDAEAYERVYEAVRRRRPEDPLVVLSAIGKTTDRLLEAARLAAAGKHQAAHDSRKRLQAEHLEIAAGLLDGEPLRLTRGGVEERFEEVRRLLLRVEEEGFLRPQMADQAASWGELLSTWIFHNLLLARGVDSALLDARRLLRTDDWYTRAKVAEEESFANIRGAAGERRGKVCVLQGFIASGPSGETTTIGRGGSDLTACLAGAALKAREIQIWTDVAGILTADPRIVPEAFKIKAISFDEAAELAYFGAKVLHPIALLPAIARDIPVFVLDSAHIDRQGTRIAAGGVPCSTPIKSIACKPGINIINIHSPRMLMAHGFARRIFEVFERRRVPIDVIATSEVNVSVTVDSDEGLDALLRDLSPLGDVQIWSGMAIISVVGHSLPEAKGVPARVFQAVKDLEVRLISQGSSQLNLTFLVSQQHMARVVRRLHGAFFQRPDPKVFEAPK